METYTNTTESKLRAAQKQVKRMKGFYIHATVYIFVNLLIILGNIWDTPNSWFNTDTFATAFFWGIGLAAHAFSVFGTEKFFGIGWEERKIRELMNQKK